ncbi:ABC transporter ATP-binding protein [Lactobacillus rossiae]|uniref:ABC transporter ATP-binding protein n=1 Tax=Furfurilactobacillus rossiae TaxID=231049 RepID=A0A7C9IX46_9LACO|nr:ABC transporter ATP-binding protein [Furfurilactobacillus milii]
MVNTILKEADLFCPNSVRINFTIYQISTLVIFWFYHWRCQQHFLLLK